MSNLIREGQIFIIITISCHELIILISRLGKMIVLFQTPHHDSGLEWYCTQPLRDSKTITVQYNTARCKPTQSKKLIFLQLPHVVSSSWNDFIHTWGLYFYAETSIQDPKRERTLICEWIRMEMNRGTSQLFDFVASSNANIGARTCSSYCSTHFTQQRQSWTKICGVKWNSKVT